jgi:hypothetical protein
MMSALVFSVPAARRFQAGMALNPDWPETFDFTDEETGVISTALENTTYVFCSAEDSIAASIVFKIEDEKLFSGFNNNNTKLEVLKRGLEAGLASIDGNGVLPDNWRPYAPGKYITFQATSFTKRDSRRLTLWRRLPPFANPCAYVFDLTSTQRDYDNLRPDFPLLEKALENREKALASRPAPRQLAVGAPSMDLTDLRSSEKVDTVTHGWKISNFLQSKLTNQQREFVYAPLDKPMRLKGAAGTGKTLAMIAKLLHEASDRKKADIPYRYLYVTHNASAATLATDYARSLDEEGLLACEPSALIQIDTLLGLAIRDLAEDLGELQPISFDAHEGKKLQLIMLSDIVSEYSKGAWVTLRSQTSENIRNAIEASRGSVAHEEFCWDLMNEIAIVLDADNVRDNVAKRDAYIKDRKRSRSLMPLEQTADREVVLDIYDRFRAQLRKEGLIGIDQLTADYLGYLDSFRWDARRQKLGYDAIFVDEFHLFSQLERAAFSPLTRNDDVTQLPIILMAVDPRQSPRTMFLDAVFGHDGSTQTPAQRQGKEVRDFEFSEVFRYTPEIARLLSYVNQGFPERDMAEEWLPPTAKSILPSGPTPIALSASDRIDMFARAISLGREAAKMAPKARTAVLTLSHKAFDLAAKRYNEIFYIVDSRDSLDRLKYSGSRIVLSMPEYVAGVQFDNVIVTDVSQLDDFGRQTALARNRFGANLYLAISRARSGVYLLADNKFGGIAPIILGAIREKIVTRTD